MNIYFPEEMLAAGQQAFRETEGMDAEQRVVLIYLAMEAVKEILNIPVETVH